MLFTPPLLSCITWGHQCSVVMRCGVLEGAVMCDSVTSAVSFCVERCDVLEAINSSRSQLFIVLTPIEQIVPFLHAAAGK